MSDFIIGKQLKETASRGKAGFTFIELMVAMAIGLGVIAASGAAYLFVSKNGKALESQIEFSNKARVLQSRFIDIVEQGQYLRVEDDTGLEIFASGADDGDEPSWIGYIEGDTLADSKIVYRPNGGDSAVGEQVLCTHVGPADEVDGEVPPMFEIITGHSVLLNVHIGDREGEYDATGPGRQGMMVSIVGTCRDLGREL